MKKRILLLAALALILVCAFAVSVSAAEPSTSDSFGEITYITDNDAINNKDDYGFAEGDHARVVVKVPGTETYLTYPAYYIFDFRDDGATKYGWQPVLNMNYLKNATGLGYDATSVIRLEIPNFFTAVSTTYTQSHTLTSLKSVVFQSNMWMLHGSAFANLPNLETVVFEGSTSTEARSVFFGERSFAGCSNLTSVTLPANTETIGTAAFLSCKKLATLVIPEVNRITTINHRAFDECEALTGTYEFTNVTFIDSVAFRNCAKAEGASLILKFPNIYNLGSSGDTHVFSYSTGLKEIYLGSSLRYMSFNTFTNCTGLEKIQIDAVDPAMTTFPSYTFDGCSSLKAFSIPEGITSLPGRMFRNCSSLKAVYLPSTLTAINSGSQDHSTFANCKKMYLVSQPFTFTSDADIPAKPDVYYFPSGLTKMTEETFKNCSGLNKTLVFPAGITTITNSWAFEAGTSNVTLENLVFLGDMVELPSSSAYWDFTGKIYLANSNDKSVADLTIGGFASKVVFCYGEGNTQHLVEPKTATGQDATCTTNKVETAYCFCGTLMYENREIENTALGHNHDLTKGAVITDIVYMDGYMSAGAKEIKCSRCDVKDYNTAVDALFNGLMYSVAEKGFGICVKYNVNRAALAVYKEAGKTMSFGVVAIMADNVVDNGPLANDGTVSAQKNVVAADVTADNMNAVTLRISGDESAWRAHSSKAIYVLGYATNGTDLEYLGTASETPAERNNITSVKSLVIGQFFLF